MDGFRHHAQQLQLLVRQNADHVKQRVLNVAAENIAGHELRGGHILQRGLGEDLPGHLRLGQLIQEGVLHAGVHLECMAQTHLLLPHAGPQSEGFVEELGGQHGVGAGDSIVGGQVVILAGVDDHAGITVDDAGEILVDDGALHIDVAEQNAVEGIVEHHIQTLQGAHGSDFGHTEAGAIVAQPDVAALLPAHFIQGFTHQAEVFLGGVSAAEALGGSAVGNIVQQTLAGGTDDSDDIRALLGASLGLDDILVNVAGGNDDVEVGAFLVAKFVQERVALAHIAVDPLQSGIHHGHDSSADFFGGVDGHLAQVQLTNADLFRHFLGIAAQLCHGVADVEGSAAGQNTLFLQVIHHDVGQGSVHIIDTVDAQQAADGTLHGNRGVVVDKGLHIVGHLGGAGAGLGHQVHIQIQFGFHIISSLKT